MKVRSRLAAIAFAVIALVGANSLTAGVEARAASSVSVATAVARILTDTNALRAAGGLPPLVANAAMSTVAQNWSAQLGAQGSLSHNPSYTTQIPSGWRRAAENVAMDYDYTTVVEGWRQSSGHYANIMGQYTDIGIGYVEANGHRYFTQNFAWYSTTVVPPVTPPATSPAPIPVVSGNRILDARTSATFTPRAVNWPSFEYACQQGWAYSSSGATAAAAAAMASWTINAVRLPLNEACWLGVDGSPSFGTASGYQAAVRAWVDTLNAAGLVVILDLHWSAPAGYPANGQRAMADARSVTFWQQVATAYSGVPSVIFDAFNEPYSRGAFSLTWSCWAAGGCAAPVENDQTGTLSGSTYTVAGMTQIVSAIRNAGATQPIMLAGLDYANDLRGWLANRPPDTQLIASWHNYPGQRCHTVSCWNGEIAPVAAVVPVFASEFGQTDGASSYLTTFMNWADAAGIGYAPWAWWVVPASESVEGSRYALINDITSFTPKAPAGTAYRDHLLGSAPPPALASTTVVKSAASSTLYIIDGNSQGADLQLGCGGPVRSDGIFHRVGVDAGVLHHRHQSADRDGDMRRPDVHRGRRDAVGRRCGSGGWIADDGAVRDQLLRALPRSDPDRQDLPSDRRRHLRRGGRSPSSLHERRQLRGLHRRSDTDVDSDRVGRHPGLDRTSSCPVRW